MLCVSFSIGTFTINHNFSQFKHLSYNMTSYYDCFVTWNPKTSTLDIFARHPKKYVALILCVGPKLWEFGILYTILSTFMWYYQNWMFSHFIIIISLTWRNLPLLRILQKQANSEFSKIPSFPSTRSIFSYDIIKKIWRKIAMQNFERFTLSARAHLIFL